MRQQNTIRNALVAALTLDIFNRHADIVLMSNIAQMINVGHSMLMTDGDKMLRMPTYYVYEMYLPHQGAQTLPIRITTPNITYKSPNKNGVVPTIAGSSSRNGHQVTVSLVNLDAVNPVEINMELRGCVDSEINSWRQLATEDIHTCNTFEDPNYIQAETIPIESEKIDLKPASVNVFEYKIY
jgi:alpha-N-arabinofuranosidase